MKTKRLIIVFTVLGLVLLVSSVNGSVTATGQRTIHQSLEGHIATDLHFKTYQADRDTAWIESWTITCSAPYTGSTMVPDDWPFDDGKTHSVTVDLTGMSVPYCTDVNITVDFTLNEYNSVKFADIYWTYDDHDPVEAMPADIGWGFNTSGSGPNDVNNWVISRYTIRNMAGQIVAIDMVGHLNPTADSSIRTMFISNGTPDDPGTNSVKITNWGAAELDYLPSWEDIEEWTDWDIFVSEVVIGPGQSVSISQANIPTVTEWGMIIMTLGLLTIGAYVIMRRQRVAA